MRVNNVSVWLVLAVVILLFFPFVWIVPRQEFFEGINAVCMSVAAGVMVGYGPAAWQSMKMPVHSVRASELLVVGIVICSAAIVGVFGGMWLWRSLDKPDYIIDSVPFAFTRWAFAGGAFIVLVSAQAIDNGITGRAYRSAGLWVAGAIMVAATLISFGIG